MLIDDGLLVRDDGDWIAIGRLSAISGPAHGAGAARRSSRPTRY